MKRILLLIMMINTGLFAAPNHVTMPLDVKVNTGYPIPYSGCRQSPGIVVGITDDDFQNNGSLGRDVWITPSGGFHFYYTYRFGGSNANRRAYYNYHIPPSYWLGPTAMDTDQSRMGSLDQMSNGRALGTANANVTGGYACRVYLDAGEGWGTFTVLDLPGSGSTACLIRPKLCVDDNDYIYIVGLSGGYSWWTMSTDEGQTWTPWDSSLAGVELNVLNFFYDHEVWAQYGDKIALVNNMGDDYFTIIYWETGNQGNTWYYDTVFCLQTTPGDSVQGFFWHSACYDNNEYLHVVFTCIDTVPGGVGALFSGWRSQIRHWNQQTGQISIVDNGMGWVNSNPGPGPCHPTVSEPQIAIDRTTGDLYCTWCYADPEDTAANGWVNMDIWGARSTDNGATWIEQHNITNSPSPGAVAGQCDNDHMNHLAEETLGDTLVMFYLNDKDAGFAAYPLDPTDNPLLFYLYKWNPTAVQEYHTETPERLNLNVLPNPFSHSTKLTYILPYSGDISLKLYSIDGRLVRTIHNGPKGAGVHKETLDLTGIANGIYFVILATVTAKESYSVIVIH